jgi:hypothetical protein
VSVVDERIVSRIMQNNESVPDHAHPSTAVNSSSSQRIAIAVVITALIFGAGGYLLGQRTVQNPSQGNQVISVQPSPSLSAEPSPRAFVPKTFYPVPTTDPVLTANWKTYKNDKYGVTFRYPSNRYINMYPYPPTINGEYPYTDDIVLHTKQTSFEENTNKESFNSLWEDMTANGRIMLFFLDETSNDVFLSSIDKDLQYSYQVNENVKDEGIVIGGKIGRITSSFSDTKSRFYNKTNNHAINIDIPLKDKKYLVIENLGTVITLDEFNQMLSTFKFSDQH